MLNNECHQLHCTCLNHAVFRLGSYLEDSTFQVGIASKEINCSFSPRQACVKALQYLNQEPEYRASYLHMLVLVLFCEDSQGFRNEIVVFHFSKY